MLFSSDSQKMVKGCLNQEPWAQQKLYDLFAPKMMAVCFRYAKDRDEAADFLQEGFIKIFQSIHKYEFQGSLEGWIRRIIVNTSIDLIRKRKASQLEMPMNTEIADTMIDEDKIDTFEVEYLLRVIQSLPTGYRVVFNLYAIEGYSHAEIGEQLGITESTSRSQYTRAKALLKKRIHEDSVEFKSYQNAI